MTEADEALIPLAVIRERFGIHERTLRRRIAASGVRTVQFNEGKAVRWGDIPKIIDIGSKES